MPHPFGLHFEGDRNAEAITLRVELEPDVRDLADLNAPELHGCPDAQPAHGLVELNEEGTVCV